MDRGAATTARCEGTFDGGRSADGASHRDGPPQLRGAVPGAMIERRASIGAPRPACQRRGRRFGHLPWSGAPAAVTQTRKQPLLADRLDPAPQRRPPASRRGTDDRPRADAPASPAPLCIAPGRRALAPSRSPAPRTDTAAPAPLAARRPPPCTPGSDTVAPRPCASSAHRPARSARAPVAAARRGLATPDVPPPHGWPPRSSGSAQAGPRRPQAPPRSSISTPSSTTLVWLRASFGTLASRSSARRVPLTSSAPPFPRRRPAPAPPSFRRSITSSSLHREDHERDGELAPAAPLSITQPARKPPLRPRQRRAVTVARRRVRRSSSAPTADFSLLPKSRTAFQRRLLLSHLLSSSPWTKPRMAGAQSGMTSMSATHATGTEIAFAVSSDRWKILLKRRSPVPPTLTTATPCSVRSVPRIRASVGINRASASPSTTMTPWAKRRLAFVTSRKRSRMVVAADQLGLDLVQVDRRARPPA